MQLKVLASPAEVLEHRPCSVSFVRTPRAALRPCPPSRTSLACPLRDLLWRLECRRHHAPLRPANDGRSGHPPHDRTTPQLHQGGSPKNSTRSPTPVTARSATGRAFSLPQERDAPLRIGALSEGRNRLARVFQDAGIRGLHSTDARPDKCAAPSGRRRHGVRGVSPSEESRLPLFEARQVLPAFARRWPDFFPPSAMEKISSKCAFAHEYPSHHTAATSLRALTPRFCGPRGAHPARELPHRADHLRERANEPPRHEWQGALRRAGQRAGEHR